MQPPDITIRGHYLSQGQGALSRKCHPLGYHKVTAGTGGPLTRGTGEVPRGTYTCHHTAREEHCTLLQQYRMQRHPHATHQDSHVSCYTPGETMCSCREPPLLYTCRSRGPARSLPFALSVNLLLRLLISKVSGPNPHEDSGLVQL